MTTKQNQRMVGSWIPPLWFCWFVLRGVAIEQKDVLDVEGHVSCWKWSVQFWGIFDKAFSIWSLDFDNCITPRQLAVMNYLMLRLNRTLYDFCPLRDSWETRGFFVVKLLVEVVKIFIHTLGISSMVGHFHLDCTTVLFWFIECFTTSRLHSIFNVDVLWLFELPVQYWCLYAANGLSSRPPLVYLPSGSLNNYMRCAVRVLSCLIKPSEEFNWNGRLLPICIPPYASAWFGSVNSIKSCNLLADMGESMTWKNNVVNSMRV